MICSTTGNSGWNLVIDLLRLLARSLARWLPRSLLVMRRRTLILETQLVDF
jgi:hypothetical protein